MKRAYVWAALAIPTSVVVIVFIAWTTVGSTIFSPDANALWRIEQRCLASAAGMEEASCVLADPSEGYILIRDRKGRQHYLLLPTKRLAGIESDELLSGMLPNYFQLAWNNRKLLSAGRQTYPRDQDVLLAINSKFGRSQGQLHIHIGCIKRTVGAQLARLDNAVTEAWAPLPVDLQGHDYLVRRVSRSQFEELGAFRIVAMGLPRAAMAMDRMSIAMAAAANGDVLLLTTERDLFDFNLASAEELQDHDCSGR